MVRQPSQKISQFYSIMIYGITQLLLSVTMILEGMEGMEWLNKTLYYNFKNYA